jgi:hypothetical protein
MSDDDRLIKALAHANYKTTIVQQRENLKLRYTNALLYAQNGGIFTVNPSLLAMVDLLIRTKQTEAVLIDDKAIPIKIDDLPTFLEVITSVYAEASNDYLVAWEKLRKARNIDQIVNS